MLLNPSNSWTPSLAIMYLNWKHYFSWYHINGKIYLCFWSVRFKLKTVFFRAGARVITKQSPSKQPFLPNENHKLLGFYKARRARVTHLCSGCQDAQIPSCKHFSNHIAWLSSFLSFSFSLLAEILCLLP